MDETDIEAQEYGFNQAENEQHQAGDNEGEEPQDQVHQNTYQRYIERRLAEEIENRKLELYKAATIGDWKKAEEIFKNYPSQITPTTRVNKLGETALHIATAADHSKFVEQLVEMMSEEDIGIKTETGNTAFCYAAVSGNIQTAILMLNKDSNLSTIRGEEDILPIRIAALHGHEKMVRHLYDQHMKHYILAEKDYVDLLMDFIDCDIYDIGRQMVFENQWLATKANSNGLTALYAFARKSHITSHNFSSNIRGGLLTKYISKRRNNVLRKQGLELLKLLLELAMSVIDERSSKLIKRALFRAAKQGNYEFITTVIDLYPDLAFELDENYYTIFHIAVLHRNVNIFNIFHEMDSVKNVIKIMKDNEDNNILHLAGKLPLSGVLEVAPGAALQLQHELLWFEEVKKVVGPHQVQAKNKEKRTPTDIFNENHEDLRREGVEWLTRTADSCMVVSTLIATVAFTGVFSVPGGNGQDTGIPLLLDNTWFKIFAISDAITLIFSASSILSFLSILNSRYSMADFLKSLPFKLLFGLFSLYISLMAMMITFIAAFFVIFKHKKHHFAYPVAAAAFIPILLVARWHLPHFHQIFRSTCTSFLQFRGNGFFGPDFSKKKYD